MYSLRMSFCTVPRSADRSTPCSPATSSYRSSRIAAVELIVIDVVTRSSGIWSKRVRMSAIESIATPTLPTSPAAIASSESSPIWVGRSKATESPVCPASRSARNRWLVAAASPKPAY
jgi:hypothetical protein